MATIVFMPFHWASDLNPTFALAGKLRDRGHRVHYFGIPDTAERIHSQGFDFTPVFSRAINQLHPDLVLTSSGTPWVGIAACRTGVPVISFCSTLISVEDSAVPPFSTDLIPKPTRL